MGSLVDCGVVAGIVAKAKLRAVASNKRLARPQDQKGPQEQRNNGIKIIHRLVEESRRVARW